MLSHAGKEKFSDLLNRAVDALEFKWLRTQERFRGKGSDQRRRDAVLEMLRLVAEAADARAVDVIQRGLIVNQVAHLLQMDRREVDETMRRLRRKRTYVSAPPGAGTVESPRRIPPDSEQAAWTHVLEVLLNEPGLYETLRQEITAEVFDVPILRQIAAVLFEMLSIDSETPLRQVLAKTESVELGRCLMELAHAGQEKGNFQSRLTGALDVIERHQAQKDNSGIEAVADQSEYLRRLYDNTDKTNVRNVGMV